MATPVAHTILGLTLADGVAARSRNGHRALYLLAAFGAVAPDLDFLPGIIRGAPSLYHQSVSHSLAAAVFFSGLVVGVTLALGRGSGRARAAGWIAGLSYASHLLLDLMGRDSRPPVGQPLLWPFSSEPVAVPWGFLPGVRHGGAPSSLGEFLVAVFSWENLLTLGVEVVFLLPPCLAAVWWSRRFPSRRGPLSPSG